MDKFKEKRRQFKEQQARLQAGLPPLQPSIPSMPSISSVPVPSLSIPNQPLGGQGSSFPLSPTSVAMAGLPASSFFPSSFTQPLLSPSHLPSSDPSYIASLSRLPPPQPQPIRPLRTSLTPSVTPGSNVGAATVPASASSTASNVPLSVVGVPYTAVQPTAPAVPQQGVGPDTPHIDHVLTLYHRRQQQMLVEQQQKMLQVGRDVLRSVLVFLFCVISPVLGN